MTDPAPLSTTPSVEQIPRHLHRFWHGGSPLLRKPIVSSDLNAAHQERLTLGQRLADHVATGAGSWPFIIGFFVFLVVWIGVNALVLVARPFDPYPFILLNLILSCIAALQAPVIMMSQNRQEAKDRLRSEQDYLVNVKSELEIEELHQKLDHLREQQWAELVAMQQRQISLLEDQLVLLQRALDRPGEGGHVGA